MGGRSRLIALATPLAIVVAAATLGASGFPKPQGYVNDFAGVLDAGTKEELAALLRDTERETTVEIAVATVDSLDGMTVEEYANKLFQAWGVGKRGKDNGVLMVVAPGERKMRIEVGYGLEPVLPDGLAGEIIRTICLPEFRNSNYSGGILAGARRIAEIAERNHRLTDEERRKIAAAADDRPPALLMVPFFGLFIGFGALAVGAGLASRTIFPLLWGGIFGGVPFLMSLVPFFNAPTWILGPFGLAMLALGFYKGRSSSWVKMMRPSDGRGRSRGSSSSSGWVMGAGSSSSSSGSGSSGGGGGSFGGGSSGGGGASGSW